MGSEARKTLWIMYLILLVSFAYAGVCVGLVALWGEWTLIPSILAMPLLVVAGFEAVFRGGR